ncbi:MAG: helix-turn-helix domain-containing protein [Saprospiraceae bacterium]
MRDIRALKGVKQHVIAQEMNLSQNGYSRLERGKTKMTEEKKKKAPEALGVSEEFLENFHEKHIFISNGQQGGMMSQAGIIQNPLPEESLEGFRAAIQNQQEEIKHLRADLASFRDENRRLREENSKISKMISEKSSISRTAEIGA